MWNKIEDVEFVVPSYFYSSSRVLSNKEFSFNSSFLVGVEINGTKDVEIELEL